MPTFITNLWEEDEPPTDREQKLNAALRRIKAKIGSKSDSKEYKEIYQICCRALGEKIKTSRPLPG